MAQTIIMARDPADRLTAAAKLEALASLAAVNR
jgi:hypothetical protein